MGIIDQTKEIADLIKKLGNVDLYRKIVDLEGEVVTLSRENHRLTVENDEAKAALAKRESMTMGVDRFYHVKGDQLPFCPVCWEKDGRAIHLPPASDTGDAFGRCCHVCDASFDG